MESFFMGNNVTNSLIHPPDRFLTFNLCNIRLSCQESSSASTQPSRLPVLGGNLDFDVLAVNAALNTGEH